MCSFPPTLCAWATNSTKRLRAVAARLPSAQTAKYASTRAPSARKRTGSKRSGKARFAVAVPVPALLFSLHASNLDSHLTFGRRTFTSYSCCRTREVQHLVL